MFGLPPAPLFLSMYRNMVRARERLVSFIYNLKCVLVSTRGKKIRDKEKKETHCQQLSSLRALYGKHTSCKNAIHTLLFSKTKQKTYKIQRLESMIRSNLSLPLISGSAGDHINAKLEKKETNTEFRCDNNKWGSGSGREAKFNSQKIYKKTGF